MTPDEFEFKTVPYPHQLNGFLKQCDRISYALFMDMGTGKTKVTIDTCAYLYLCGKIDGLLVLGPSGVETNWIRREIPKHLHDGIPFLGRYWQSNSGSKWLKKWDADVRLSYNGLKAFGFASESLSSARVRDKVVEVLESGRFMLVVDESHMYKSPSAVRVKFLHKVYGKAPYRRILSGSAVTNTPLDLWSQYAILHWKILGYENFYGFKARYAITKKMARPDKLREAQKSGKELTARDYYDSIVGFRNIEELKSRMAPYTFRVKKSEVLDLPEKIYKIRYVKLEGEQKALYEQMLDSGVAILSSQNSLPQFDSKEELLWYALTSPDVSASVAQNALTIHLRLQQITGGFLKDENGSLWKSKVNPKIEATLSLIADHPGKVVVWCRFVDEITALAEAIQEPSVLYYGGVSAEDRDKNLDAFEREDGPRIFIGTQAAGGTGINLVSADMAIYYSNSFNAAHRWQSEDRLHRIGQKNSVVYVDLVVPESIDEKVVDNLQNKIEISASILDDGTFA